MWNNSDPSTAIQSTDSVYRRKQTNEQKGRPVENRHAAHHLGGCHRRLLLCGSTPCIAMIFCTHFVGTMCHQTVLVLDIVLLIVLRKVTDGRVGDVMCKDSKEIVKNVKSTKYTGGIGHFLTE